jgi:hypothetical protein
MRRKHANDANSISEKKESLASVVEKGATFSTGSASTIEASFHSCRAPKTVVSQCGTEKVPEKISSDEISSPETNCKGMVGSSYRRESNLEKTVAKKKRITYESDIVITPCSSKERNEDSESYSTKKTSKMQEYSENESDDGTDLEEDSFPLSKTIRCVAMQNPVTSRPAKLRCVPIKNPVVSDHSQRYASSVILTYYKEFNAVGSLLKDFLYIFCFVHHIPIRQSCQIDCESILDFTVLVNFPDYLTRSTGDVILDGKKHCVMCGELRVCSASSAKLACKKGNLKQNATQESASETQHIIPRQNKGVCTLCDVAVWTVLGYKEKVEIKWCKGCKNFRPWVAFGEKRMATKCVRCRTRQKETYANQKRENIRKNNQWVVRKSLVT